MGASDAKQGRMRAIAVCGPAIVDDALAGVAEEIGRRIAEAGCALVCGGLGGAMEHAARGARKARLGGAGGLVVGILPGAIADEANAFCDVVIPSGMGVARNALVVGTADAVIALGGGSGTLSELALAWQLGKPIIALRQGTGWAPRLAGQRLDDRRADELLAVDTPTEAVAVALEQIAQHIAR